jgi:uncharacterized protein (TIGR02271 family)
MASTVIGFYDTDTTAQQVIQELQAQGVSRQAIDHVTGSGSAETVAEKLVSAGAPRNEAELYQRGIEGGGSLITVTVDETQAAQTASIMQKHDPIYIEALNEWLSSRDTTAAVAGSATDNGMHVGNAVSAGSDVGETSIPVVEEQLRVGKREVSRGGVRVSSYVTETPVEEQIRLRDETIYVERRPVDRPLSSSDGDLFRERTLELTETDEEVVVAKEVRVVEEVIVSKAVEERVETVRDKVRRTDVDIEHVGGGVSVNGDYSKFETDFRTHYDGSSFRNDYSYEQSQPAYRYGYALASDQRYQGRDWSAIEADVRGEWEKSNKGTWEQFKDSVRYAWERARG